MFISHNREKLLNAIIYFVEHTKYCHTLKLFKLLNFLDFEHYRLTGVPVTGQVYKAWANGPAPPELWHEMQSPSGDLAKAVTINTAKDDLTDEPKRRDIRPRRPFSNAHFTPREMDIMAKLSEIFFDTRGEDMRDVSHIRNLPWRKVYAGGSGRGRKIPYELAMESDPIIGSLPTLGKEEWEARKALFREIEQATAE